MELAARRLIFILYVICFTPLFARGQTFNVNSVEDLKDLNPGDGLCVSYLIISPPFVLPFCTLRGAIEETNSLPGDDIIQIPSRLISLAIQGPEENSSITGDLDITDSLTISGKGAEISIIDGKSLDRIIDVIGKNVAVTIKDLTLINGQVSTASLGSFRGGGAIRNEGNLTLENVVLLNHGVTGDENHDLGGILLNFGQCLINNSTLQGGDAFEGGAIYNANGAEMSILSSTISGNDAVIGAGGSNYGSLQITNSTISTNGSSLTLSGGGFENRSDAILIHATFAYNEAKAGGGIGGKSRLYMQNTIVGNNIGGDCYGSKYIYSNGYNIDSDGSCGLTESTDIGWVDPGLQPLKNNGGINMTHSLYPLSPARETGVLVPELAYDQRGVSRPLGKGADIGAVENNVFALPPLILPIVFR